MPQATLLANITANGTSNPLSLNEPSTIKVQFTPAYNGFSGTVLLQFAVTQYIQPGYLWYPIATIGINPWSSLITLQFSGHTTVLAFDVYLGAGTYWMRTVVTNYSQGAISAYGTW